MCEITLPLAATSAERAPKSSWEKRSVLQNAEKKKLVLGIFYIPSIIQGHLRTNHTFTVTLYLGKTLSHLNTSFLFLFFKAAHNSRHNTINSRLNQHQYLHFTDLQLRKVQTGMFSFVDQFSTKLKRSNLKYIYICLLHCYDTQHVWEPIFIFCRHSVISDSLWWQVVRPMLVTDS